MWLVGAECLKQFRLTAAAGRWVHLATRPYLFLFSSCRNTRTRTQPVDQKKLVWSMSTGGQN